jgi:predicted ATPase
MLDLPVEDYFWREMTVEEKYEQMLDAAVALLQRFSLEKRTVLVMEDLHWIDSGTKGFIEKLLDGIAGVPVLVLMNFRPEFEHGWGGRSVFSQINLDPLGDEDAGDLASALLGADESVAALKVALVERTKGLPFFLEETVRTLFESGLLQGKTGAYRLAGSTTEKAVATIPPNVQSVLAARIDRLPAEEKHLLQSASVIGKDFSLALLASANDQEEADLQAALAHLQATEFIYEVRKLPNSVFTFKQALTQDVAYNSLLKNERRPLHAAVAASLKENFPERCADNPEMLAHHLTEGGNAPEAVEAWLEAGNKASRRAANREALQHYNKGLEVLEDLPESPERNTNEIAIRVALGVPMGYLEGAETQAFEDNYLRARELCEATGEKRDLFPVLWGLFMSAMMQAKIDRMCQLADNILDVAEDGDDESLLLEAHHCQWAARFLVGDLAQAAAHCRIGQKLYRRDEHHVLTFIYGGHDPLGCAYNISAQALSLSGFPDQALAECDRSVALARELDHPGTLAEALYCAMLIGTILHDVSWIEGRAEALEAFAEGSAVSYYHLMTKGAKGWTIYQKGQRHEGLALMRETVPMWLESGVTWTAPFVTLLAEALVQEEFVSEALDVITKAMGMADRDGVRWYEAELHRVKGVILRHDAGGDAEAAETSIHRALELAREQGAKLLELRAAISLAALWQTQNRSAEARALLEPAYGWFTEGRDSRDLRQAKRLLESLA